MDNVADRVYHVVSRVSVVPLSALQDDTDLAADLSDDPIDLVEMLLLLEQEFGVPLLDEEAEQVRTLGELVALLLATVHQATPGVTLPDEEALRKFQPGARQAAPPGDP